ncbi:hypothetical protein ACWEP5_21365 [Nocardia niigatensis]
MSTILEVVASWKTLSAFLLAVAVFGFFPGFVLRLIVRIYPRDDPRRRELPAELYTVKLLMRPFWVAEQLETVLFDGTESRFLKWHTARVEEQMKADALEALDRAAMRVITERGVSDDDVIHVEVIHIAFGDLALTGDVRKVRARCKTWAYRLRRLTRSRKRRDLMRRYESVFRFRIGSAESLPRREF